MSVVCSIDLLNLDYEFQNSQKSSLIGRRKDSPKYGWFEVVEGDYTHIKIRFDNTGSERVIKSSGYHKPYVKDYYAPNILGVACIGNAKKSTSNKMYQAWHHMIERCYNKNSEGYGYCGALGVRVSKDWLVFENFLRDYSALPKVQPDEYKGKLELDKDLKQIDIPMSSRVYSKDTCSLVCKDVNQFCRGDSIVFSAKNKDGRVSELTTVKMFEQTYEGILRSCIYNCLNPLHPQNTHRDWSFEKVEITEDIVREVVDKIINMEE